MIKISKFLSILAILFASMQLNAAGFPLSKGVWEVVKLNPPDNQNLLEANQIYFVFFSNGNLLECTFPINKSSNAKIKKLKYQTQNNKLIIIENGESTEHPVETENGLVKMGVPFGTIGLKPSEISPLNVSGLIK